MPAADKPPLHSRVPDETHLHDYWQMLRRRARLVIAVFAVVMTGAVLHTLLTTPAYQATAQVLIERDAPSVLTFKEVTEVQAQGWGDEYYQTQFKLLQSRALVRKVVKAADLLQEAEYGGPRDPREVAAAWALPEGQSALIERVIDVFLGRLQVRFARGSRLVSVTMESGRPEQSAQLANLLAREYIAQTLEFKVTTSSDAADWLGGQIGDQRQKVAAAEVALQKLKEREGIVNIEERRTLQTQRLADLGTALNTAKTQRLQKQALYDEMKRARSAEELPAALQSSLIQGLRLELANLERQHAQLLERYLEQHPEVVKARRQVQEQRQKIAAESQRIVRAAENDFRAAQAEEASLAQAVEAIKAEMQDLSERGREYDSLKRELDAAKEVLNSLLAREKQTDVVQQLKSSNIRIADPAVVPRAPVRPNRVVDLGGGLLFGMVLSLGLAFFLDYLDNTVRTPEDVQKHLGIPLLAVIPETPFAVKEAGSTAPPGPQRLIFNPNQRGPFVEGYRVLRTALNYSWPGQDPRILTVTSTAPGEGKTLTSINLALTLSSLGARVLLVDADLRKSDVHATLKAKRSPGLSDVLVGNAAVSEAVQRLPGTTLSLLAAGRGVPSPADLLTVGALKGLLDGLRGHYHWIVVDTPPVAAVADSLVVAQLTDGVIVVVGAEMVPHKAVAQTLDRVGATGARVVGVVLNRSRVERRYGYYYGYHYGHYYGAPQPDASREATVLKRAAR